MLEDIIIKNKLDNFKFKRLEDFIIKIYIRQFYNIKNVYYIILNYMK